MCRTVKKTNSQGKHLPRVPIHRLTEERYEHCLPYTSLPTSDDEFLFPLASTSTKTPIVKVKINDQPVKMLLDTGASTNILDKATFDKLSAIKPIALTKSPVKIVAYGSQSPLPVVGKFDATIESKRNISVSPIYVLEGSAGSLLSYNTANDLGLIRLSVNATNGKPFASDTLKQRFPKLFNGIGCLRNFEVKLHIDERIPPVAQAPRRIPFHMRRKVSEALNELEKQDIIERVDGPTPYISPLVVIPKKDGKVPLCVDMRVPNKEVQRTRHPSPTIDDLIHLMNGATAFSKLDLKSGYHQLTLAPECRYITTFATHKGLRRYKRLNFGTNAASEIFQSVIHDQIRNIPGVLNISDDVIVFGTDQEAHDTALQSVFEQFAKVGLTLNSEKCLFNQKSLTYFGFVFSAQGLSPDPHKVKAIQEAPPPTSVKAVRSFLGMASYCSKFIHNFSHLADPLRELTKKDVPFKWTGKHDHAFKQLKAALTSSTDLSYFDPKKETEVVTDASPYGLSAILTQATPGQDDRKVIAYVSRSLTPVERRYSQTEREALAIVWAVERLHTYLYGSSFTLYTDCKPIELILNNPRSKTSARIERWNLRLQDYCFHVVYTKGQQNPSDFLSRHTTDGSYTSQHEQSAERYVNFITYHSIPKAMTLDEIKVATCNDATMQHLIAILRNTQSWESLTKATNTLPSNVNKADLLHFHRLRNELVVTDKENIVLRGSRIVLPQPLRSRAIEIAREGHQGLVKTKMLLREKIWFPSIDELTKQLLDQCIPCQANGPDSRPDPLQMSPLPPEPWHTVNVDFCGPFPTGE